jgi:hypothetical protein
MIGARIEKAVILAVAVAVADRGAGGETDTGRDRHWAFEPPVRPALPAVRNREWARTPIDLFILARLEAAGLEPSPAAARTALLRRAALDMTGLPPSPAEIQAFLEDGSGDAFEKVADRLLASPHHGERWARHWLDVARFAESHGYEFDRLRENAWRYRDYVVESLNGDKPYDRFVREQIAGDVLPDATRETIAATGFLVAGPWDEAGNTSASALLKERIREDELEEMIAAVGQTFLGMTVNCARCHDHKFDPIPQRDYYRFKAALQGVRHGERPLLTPAEERARAEEIARLESRIRAIEAEAAAIERPARAEALRALEGAGSAPAGPPAARWTFEVDAADSSGTLHGTVHAGARIAGGRLLLNGKDAFVETRALTGNLHEKTLEAWVSLSTLSQRGGGVLTVEAGGGRPFDGIVFGEREARRWMAGSDFFERTRSLESPAETAGPGEIIHVAIVYEAGGRIAFYRNGAPHGKSYVPEGPSASLRTYPRAAARVLIGLRHAGAANGFLAGEIEEARLYDRALEPEEVAASFRAGPLRIAPEEVARRLSPAERSRREALEEEGASLRAALEAIPPAPMAYAARSVAPGSTFVLERGDVERRKEPVTAGGLSAVRSEPADFGLPEDAPEGERRLRLAEWIASPRNPLTARVIANRIWHHHFGRGIVATPSDLGANGERPSHPELLDWLACELVEGGWSLKRIHRLILLSSAYRQGQPGPEAAARAARIDAENRLLWRYPVRRLEAEAVRDAMLRASGRLDERMGGPSFRPFTVTVSGSNFYHLVDASGPEPERRTLYRMTVHSGRDPLLDSLDCPEPSTKTPVRGATATPIQSLGLMNNVFVLRQAAAFAERLRREAGPDIVRQVRLAHEIALSRAPRGEEAAAAAAHAAAEGLESLAWCLFNSSEFLHVE